MIHSFLEKLLKFIAASYSHLTTFLVIQYIYRWKSNSCKTYVNISLSTLTIAVVIHCFRSFKLIRNGRTNTFSLTYPHKKKLQAVRPGFCDGQVMSDMLVAVKMYVKGFR